MNNNELKHYGVLGMKWGIRRYQPYSTVPRQSGKGGKEIGEARKVKSEGSLNEKKYGKYIQKLEKKARKENYRKEYKDLKAKDRPWFRGYSSTGKNYEKVQEEYYRNVETSKELQKLSKNASDLERKRLLMEKEAYGKNGEYDEGKYFEIINSKEYQDLDNKSREATEKKNNYMRELTESYVDKFKDAKLKDIGIEDVENAKKYISDKFYDFWWDGNLEWNPDNFYTPGDEDSWKWKWKVNV